eukprot:GHVP01001542.1.p1 GENE.GHVP01001542.1~~GHVP01001542.1.p1  ORF type:complete len:1183 (+),score=247.84 GHVP01001542.1:1162-4710(+)
MTNTPQQSLFAYFKSKSNDNIKEDSNASEASPPKKNRKTAVDGEIASSAGDVTKITNTENPEIRDKPEIKDKPEITDNTKYEESLSDEEEVPKLGGRLRRLQPQKDNLPKKKKKNSDDDSSVTSLDDASPSSSSGSQSLPEESQDEKTEEIATRNKPNLTLDEYCFDLENIPPNLPKEELEETVEKTQGRKSIKTVLRKAEKLTTADSNTITSPTDNKLNALLALPACRSNFAFRAFLEAYFGLITDYDLPSWIDPERMKDSDGRLLTDPNFNTCSITVPIPQSVEGKRYTKHLSPCMSQYWNVKKQRFTDILFFKLGKFYEIFYTDAFICQRTCDMKWMGHDEKPHVGFPEVSLHAYAKKMVDLGFRVTVVEQMETPKELEKRMKDKKGSAKEHVVKRDICEVFSKGIIHHEKMLTSDSQFLMVFKVSSSIVDGEQSNVLNYIFLDVSTSSMFVGTSVDDERFMTFRTLIATVSPVEMIFDAGNTPQQINRYIDNLPIRPQVVSRRTLSDLEARAEIRDVCPILFGIEDLSKASSDIFQTLSSRFASNLKHFEKFLDNEDMQMCLATLNAHLKSSLIEKRALTFVKIEGLDIFNEHKEVAHLVLDEPGIKSLQILESPEGTSEDTLLAFIDHCVTPFGKRLLRRWLAAPLTSVDEINKRLDAVQYFGENRTPADEMHIELSKLPDLERMTLRLAIQSAGAVKGAVYFAITPDKKLREICEFLGHCEKSIEILKTLEDNNQLEIFVETNSAKFEDVKNAIDHLKNLMITTDDKMSIKNGFDENYDTACDKLDLCKKGFFEAKDRIAEQYGIRPKLLNFVHTKFKYEIEVSESDVPPKLKKDAEITSQRKGFLRFHTNEITEKLPDLDDCEAVLNEASFSLISNLILKFLGSYQTHLDELSYVLGKLDCLLSLAKISFRSPVGKMCKPILSKRTGVERPRICLRNCKHPMLAEKLGDSFIANDIKINTSEKPTENSLLVTGPNMGGKSTLLRQVAIAVIMAQIGCFVAAEEAELTIVDRIFTRIGARDSILEGKSSLLVEMEETSAILNEATMSSLALVDELGRGTSTFDGTAIALASLDHMAQKGCLTLFSTHFNLIADEMANSPWVSNYHMQSRAEENDDTKVTFLYHFTKGVCPRSYGLNVARLAGLPDSILKYKIQIHTMIQIINSVLFQKSCLYVSDA